MTMNPHTTATFWTVACVLSVLALIVADRRQSPLGRALFKQGASTCFVVVAWTLGALDTVQGQWIFAGLVLGWVGDAFLLGQHPNAFLGGLGAFLFSHGAYAVAFSLGPVSWQAVAGASVVAAVGGGVILRWLWPHLGREFKLPVLAYILTILTMCVLAAGATAATGRWLLVVGAVLFVISDVAVARDRFVVPSPTNNLWGWPTYFASQLMLAWSVA